MRPYHVAPCVTVLLAGCASWTQPFFHRPVVEDSVKDILSTVSLAADRRTVIVRTKDGVGQGEFCAEPPPDSATSLATQASLTASAKRQGMFDASLDGNDQSATAVTVLADRTPSLDGFRMGVYALCQYRLNGMIKDDKEFVRLFDKLIDKFSENVKAEVSRSPRPIYVTSATGAMLPLPAASAPVSAASAP